MNLKTFAMIFVFIGMLFSRVIYAAQCPTEYQNKKLSGFTINGDLRTFCYYDHFTKYKIVYPSAPTSVPWKIRIWLMGVYVDACLTSYPGGSAENCKFSQDDRVEE